MQCRPLQPALYPLQTPLPSLPPLQHTPTPPPIWRNILSKFPPVGKVTAGGLVHWFNEPWWEVHPSPLRGCSAWSPTAKSTCLTLKICCRRSTTRYAPCLPPARSPHTILSCTHSFVCTFIHVFVHSFILSCVRSFARLSIHPCTHSLGQSRNTSPP